MLSRLDTSVKANRSIERPDKPVLFRSWRDLWRSAEVRSQSLSMVR
jgi:hypothetical protein